MARSIGSTRKTESRNGDGTESNQGVTEQPTDGTISAVKPDGDGTDGAISNDTKPDNAINPSTLTASGAGASSNGSSTGTGKRRGRPAGSHNRATKREPTETAQNLEALLLSIHVMAASFFKVPELELTKEEAEKLAVAAARVADLYEISVIPEKLMAWILLGNAAVTVYGPRIVAYNITSKRKLQKPVVMLNRIDLSQQDAGQNQVT